MKNSEQKRVCRMTTFRCLNRALKRAERDNNTSISNLIRETLDFLKRNHYIGKVNLLRLLSKSESKTLSEHGLVYITDLSKTELRTIRLMFRKKRQKPPNLMLRYLHPEH